MMESVYERGYPETAMPRLMALLDQVHPRMAISIGRWDDKTSWVLHEQQETAEEMAAAQAILAEFDPWADLIESAEQEVLALDDEPPLEDIREAYEESHAEPEPDEMGLAEPADDVSGGAGLDGDGPADVDLGEAEADAPAGDDPAGDPAYAGQGVLVTGDPLKAAQMELTWQVGDKEDELVSQYPADENLARLNELRGIALAIKEGVHPAFDEETAAELQALETFASWLSAVRTNADRLRNAIRQAADQDALGLIDIEQGWPE